MPLTKETYKIQSELASYCRTDVMPELPGVTDGRLQHYRRLVYAVIEDTFEGAFPITRSFVNQQEWIDLVTGFFKKHACQTPSVWRLPYELYEYVSATELKLKVNYPFLTDLLYFEWLEIEVHTMPDQPAPNFKEEGNWLKDFLVFNPEFKLIQVNYPVHLFKPNELIENARKGDYFVLIFREPETGKVQFFDLSAFFGYLLIRLKESERNMDLILGEACPLFGLERTNELEQRTEEFLQQLKQQKFLFGYTY